MTTPIDVDDFKSHYDRDFIFGTTIVEVRDKDIQAAIDRAVMLFNPDLFNTDLEKETVFYPLVAHCLVKALESGGGIDNRGSGTDSTGSGPINSKSAGGLSVSYSLPAELLEDPILNDLLTTGYGKMYLQLVVPLLLGGVTYVEGGTQP